VVYPDLIEISFSWEDKSLTVDFHPAQNHVGSPAGPLRWEWNNTTLLQYAILFQQLNSSFRIIFRLFWTSALAKRFFFYLNHRAATTVFARDENPLSTTCAFNCTCVSEGLLEAYGKIRPLPVEFEFKFWNHTVNRGMMRFRWTAHCEVIDL